MRQFVKDCYDYLLTRDKGRTRLESLLKLLFNLEPDDPRDQLVYELEAYLHGGDLPVDIEGLPGSNIHLAIRQTLGYAS